MLPMHSAKALHHHLILGCLLNQRPAMLPMHNAKALHHHLMIGCLLLPEKSCTCGGEPLRVRPIIVAVSGDQLLRCTIAQEATC